MSELKPLLEALFKAKQELKNPPKHGMGNWGPYARLEDVLETVEPVLARHGLLIVQAYVEPKKLYTAIYHPESGESLNSEVDLPNEKGTAQGLGASTTYLRRYSILAMLSLSTEDDPDSIPTQPKGATAPSVGRVYTQPFKAQQAPISEPRANQGHLLGSAGEYVVGFGKYKGQRLNQVGVKPALDYLDWLEKNSQETSKPMGKSALEFSAAVMQYQDELMNRANEPRNDFAPPSPTDEDYVPF